MNYHIIVQTTYKQLEFALFSQHNLLAKDTIPNKEISKSFISQLEQLLTSASIPITALSFIGATQGPAPFTSLRATLATLNGIAFAQQIPLVGLSTIEILLKTYAHAELDTVALFHAFGNDVYYGYLSNKQISPFQATSIDDLLSKLAQNAHQSQKNIQLIGPAVQDWVPEIKQYLDQYAFIQNITYPTLHTLSTYATSAFNKQAVAWQLLPEYFKPAIRPTQNCS